MEYHFANSTCAVVQLPDYRPDELVGQGVTANPLLGWRISVQADLFGGDPELLLYRHGELLHSELVSPEMTIRELLDKADRLMSRLSGDRPTLFAG